MLFYIIRHAIAEPLGEANAFSDERRALTPVGRERMQRIAKGLRRLAVEFDLVLTSPLVRAVETAEILVAEMGASRDLIKQTETLAPGASFEPLFEEIRRYPAVESLAVVGHQPGLGDLVSLLVVGQPGALALELKKGSVCLVKIERTIPSFRGRMAWLLAPKQLRLIAKA